MVRSTVRGSRARLMHTRGKLTRRQRTLLTDRDHCPVSLFSRCLEKPLRKKDPEEALRIRGLSELSEKVGPV